MKDSKLDHIRAQADALGIKYHHKAGVEKIRKAIDLHLEAEMAQNQEAAATLKPLREAPVTRGEAAVGKKVTPLTEAEYKALQKKEDHRLAGSLIRCMITCMDPSKRGWPGEIISVGSAKLGTFKKYVPYDTGEPYHLPKIIFDMLSEKKCSVYYNAVGDKGHKTRKSKLINAYNLQRLDPLTPEKLKDLAKKQALQAGNIG